MKYQGDSCGRAKNYENILKFVKICYIVNHRLFFRTRCLGFKNFWSRGSTTAVGDQKLTANNRRKNALSYFTEFQAIFSIFFNQILR